MAKFKFRLSMHYVGCEDKEIIEIPDETLEGMTDEERSIEVSKWYEEWI